MDSRRRHKHAADALPTPPKTPVSIPPSAFLRDVSNYKTPKSHLPYPSACSFSPLPIYFTASSKMMTHSSSSSVASASRRYRNLRPNSASAHSKSAARRLKALELEQSQSSRKVQVRREKALMSFSRTLSAWLNFLFKDPIYCGCTIGAFSGNNGKDVTLLDGKRESKERSDGRIQVGKMWRSPKRKKESSLITATGNFGVEKSLAMLSSLKMSLKEICSLDDMIERMKCYISQRSCEEVLYTMSQVCKSIDEGRLKMKAHCPVVTDIGLKERAIGTLMCYNPMWLKIGLYIIFGGDSLLSYEKSKSYQETLFLRKTIESQLLSHTGIAKSYAHNKFVEGIYMPGYYEALGSIILKRVLLLVVLLDKAKCESSLPITYGIDGLDGGSPLLFHHYSDIKSSQKIISELLSEAVLGEGNLLSHLGVLGFKVKYEQFLLSEYDFNIKDLFEDLQDGILLSRAIQLLRHDASILSKLMAPCDTHKKKLHNCTVAMIYLKEAGVQLSDGGILILGEDIVNGEKDLALSVIWNMFVHLQVPLLVEKSTLAEEINKITCNMADSDYSSLTIMDLLLKWIQAVCGVHGVNVDSFSSLVDGEALYCLLHHYLDDNYYNFQSKLFVQENKVEHKLHDQDIISSSAVVVPKLISVQSVTTKIDHFPEILQLCDILDHDASLDERSMIMFLVFLASRLISRSVLNQRKVCFVKRSDISPQTTSLVVPQCPLSVTSLLSSSKTKSWSQGLSESASPLETKRLSKRCTEECAARIIQSHTRGFFERKRFLKIRSSTCLLQSVTRAWLAASSSRQNVVIIPYSVGQLSSCNYYRYLVFLSERYNFLRVKRSVLLIQEVVRTWIKNRQGKKILHEQAMAATKMQSAWRRYIMRKFLLNCRSAAIKIQSQWRCWLARASYLREVTAIIRMQAFIRWLLLKESFYHKSKAAIVIQKAIRGLLTRNRLLGASSLRSVRLRFKLYNLTASRVQEHVEVKIILESVVRIQRWWKHHLFHGLQVRSAILLQSFFRGHSTRKTAIKLYNNIALIQRWWRQILVIQSRKRRVLIIQAHIRGWLARRAADRKKSSIVIIQSHWRGYLARKGSIKQLLDTQRNPACIKVNYQYESLLVNRLLIAFANLNGIRSTSNIRQTCAALSMGTERSEKCCEALVSAGAIRILLDKIRSLNRGNPDQEVMKHILATLRNIIRHRKLLEVLIDTPQSGEIIFQEVLRNKREGFFIACEILKELCTTPKGNQAVHSLQNQLRRLSNLVQGLELKIELQKRNTRLLSSQRDMNMRRLQAAANLLHSTSANH